MPFVSEAQRRRMWAVDRELAKRWEEETPEGVRLPERVRGGSRRGKGERKRGRVRLDR